MIYKYFIFIFLLLNSLIFDFGSIFRYFIYHENSKKKFLIIGGTSGLGLAVALNLQVKGHNITIASRNKENLILISKIHNFEYCLIDICKEFTLQEIYDYILCTAGAVSTGLFKDLCIIDFRKDMEVNYFGPINLLNTIKTNKYSKPINVIFISSTSTSIPIPGFIAYSPSKIALELFIEIVNLELNPKNIFVKVFHSNTIKTEGFKKENINKPEVTKRIELYDKTCWSVDERAECLIDNFNLSSSFSDKFTYIMKIGRGIGSWRDLIYVYVGGIVRLITLGIIKKEFDN